MKRREYISRLSTASILLSSPGYLLNTFSKRASKNILLYSGWNTQNIGDQGHTPGTLRFFENYYPEASITLWLASTNEETKSMLLKRFPWIKKIVGGKISPKGVCDHPDLQAAFDNADLVLHNSGMHYNSFWKAPAILEACTSTNKAIACYGQSFDGFTEEDREHMVEQLSQAKAIYCRDTESFYYLREIGVRSPILEFGPDGCFGIDLLNEDKARKYMTENGLKEKEFISVIIRTNTPAGKRPGDLPEWDNGDQSQNPWDPDDRDNEQTLLWMSKVREVIISWVRRTGKKVLLAPEVSKEIKHARWLIYDQLPADVQANVVHKSEWWNMDEACSIYRYSHTVVGVEPHSCIMALANDTPMIHFFSKLHGRKAWMFRDIGLPEWLINIDEEPSSTVSHALMDIHQDYEKAQQKVKRAMNFVSLRSSEIMNDLKNQIE